MSAHTDLIRSACDWIDRHPELPTPNLSGYEHGTVTLSWYLRDTPGIDETTVAKAILAATGGPSAWKAIPSGDRVTLLGPHKPFTFTATVSAPRQRHEPADLDHLGVQS